MNNLCAVFNDPLRGQPFIALGTGWTRIGDGMKTFSRTLGVYDTLWRMFEEYEIV